MPNYCGKFVNRGLKTARKKCVRYTTDFYISDDLKTTHRKTMVTLHKVLPDFTQSFSLPFIEIYLCSTATFAHNPHYLLLDSSFEKGVNI